MALEEYRDPVLKALIDKFEAEGPAELRGHYIYGDTLAPAAEMLPCVSVAYDGNRIRSDGTMQDTNTKPIVVSVIYDWRRDLDQSYDLSRGSTALYRLIEERNDDFSLKAGSLAYVLRANQKLADNLFISINDDGLFIDYGAGWEKRGDNIFSVEGSLRFNLELTEQKPNLY